VSGTRKRIGIYGGAFNPPHLGHLAAARAAVDALGLNCLLLVPSALSPHKSEPPGTPSPEHRYNMTALMAKGISNAKPSRAEIERGGVSYTADTLAAVRECEGDGELWLVVGADMFLSMHTWARPAEIFRLASVAALARVDGQREELERQADKLSRSLGALTRIVEHEPVEVSSSGLRAALKTGGGRELLPPGVWEYIAEHGLYRESVR